MEVDRPAAPEARAAASASSIARVPSSRSGREGCPRSRRPGWRGSRLSRPTVRSRGRPRPCPPGGGSVGSRRGTTGHAPESATPRPPRRSGARGSWAPDQRRTSALLPFGPRSWTSRLSEGRGPGGSPLAVIASTSPSSDRTTSTARGKASPARSPSPGPDGRLVADRPEGAERAVEEGFTERTDARMEPRGEVGDDDGAGLLAAQGDLIVRVGVGAGRVQADGGQALGGGPSEGLGPQVELAADECRLDPGDRQGAVEVEAAGEVGQGLEAGAGGVEPDPFAVGEVGRPGPFLGAFSDDEEVHRGRFDPRGREPPLRLPGGRRGGMVSEPRPDHCRANGRRIEPGPAGGQTDAKRAPESP